MLMLMLGSAVGFGRPLVLALDARNFSTAVGGAEAHALVLFYAPGCQHSAALRPELELVAAAEARRAERVAAKAGGTVAVAALGVTFAAVEYPDRCSSSKSIARPTIFSSA